MAPALRLLAVLAHPDDESLGVGGTLARYGAEGVETFLVTATRGERGRVGSERPGPAIVGPLRERELRAAAEVLGISEVVFLDYLDAELDRAPVEEAVGRIAAAVRRFRPQVVITFPHDGSYGHPDHVAISQLTGAALVEAAAPGPAGEAGHRVDKLYWIAWRERLWSAYREAFGDLVARVGGVERRADPWPDWAVTTAIDTRAVWRQVWRAVQCHGSQLAGYAKLSGVSPEHHEAIWGAQEFYRVWSRVECGRGLESDLFEGLR